MDADVRLRAKQILAPNLPIDDLNAKLSLNDGVLKFEPAAFGVANGRIEIYSTFDGSKHPSKVNIDARLKQLDLKRFLGKSSFAQKTIGPIGGRINISGTGESFRELMATASGNTFLVMSGGEISELLVRLAGLDVAHTLGVLVRGDKPIPIRCGVLDLQGENGQMGVQTLVFDTANSVISGEGMIDLRDEKVNIVVIPDPKNFSPLSLRSFIRVTGGFKNVSVFPDPIKTGTDSLFKKIFNVLTMLVLSPLQPRDLGLGKDVDCDALIASVQKRIRAESSSKMFIKQADQKSSGPIDHRATICEREAMSKITEAFKPAWLEKGSRRMLVLLVGVIFGLAIGYFATQNTTPVTIQVAQYAFKEVPLYLVIVGSLFVGLFIAWILYFARSISSTLAIHGRDHALKRARQTTADLEMRVQELQAENAQLKTDHSYPFESPIGHCRKRPGPAICFGDHDRREL